MKRRIIKITMRTTGSDKTFSEKDEEMGYNFYVYNDGFTFKAVSDETEKAVLRNGLKTAHFSKEWLMPQVIDNEHIDENTAFIPVCFTDRFTGEKTSSYSVGASESYDYSYLDKDKADKQYIVRKASKYERFEVVNKAYPDKTLFLGDKPECIDFIRSEIRNNRNNYDNAIEDDELNTEER